MYRTGNAPTRQAGFLTGYNDRFTRNGDLVRKPGSSQSWELGSVVRVGFMRNLTVCEKHSGGEFILRSDSGKFYSFVPHMGITAI